MHPEPSQGRPPTPSAEHAQRARAVGTRRGGGVLSSVWRALFTVSSAHGRGLLHFLAPGEGESQAASSALLGIRTRKRPCARAAPGSVCRRRRSTHGTSWSPPRPQERSGRRQSVLTWLRGMTPPVLTPPGVGGGAVWSYSFYKLESYRAVTFKPSQIEKITPSSCYTQEWIFLTGKSRLNPRGHFNSPTKLHLEC